MEFADRKTVGQMNAERDASVQEELVVAENGNVSWIDEKGKKEVLLDEGNTTIRALTSDENTIYIGESNGEVKDLGTGEKVVEGLPEVSDHDDPQYLGAIEFFNGNLYGSFGRRVFDLENEEVLRERDYVVNALETCEGRLIDGTNGGLIFNTLENKEIVRSSETVNAIASSKTLFYGGNNSVESTSYIRANDEEKITERDMVTALTEVEGDIYDAASDVVYRNFDEEFYRIEDTPAGVDIYDMAAVSREVVESLRGDM